MIKPTLDQVNKVYDLMKQIIDIKLSELSVKYYPVADAPNSYKSMRKSYDDFGLFLVYNGGCHGLLGQEYNIKFRALHDFMHYTYNITFKFDDERRLSDITRAEFKEVAERLEASEFDKYLLDKIIAAEIEGQIDYYQLTGEYVEDQKEFILSKLKVDMAS